MAVSNVNNESINYHKRILSEAKVGVAFPNMRACIIIIIIIIKAKIIVTLYIKNVTGALYTVNYNENTLSVSVSVNAHHHHHIRLL